MQHARLPPRDNPCGSLWHRWDPHIHAPGTVLNDQFTGDDPLEEYLLRVERLTPPVRALGVTDYFGLDLYKRVSAAHRKGRLPGVGLLFPNVEMRFAVAAARGSPVNCHLLISPESPDHVEQAERLLLSLTFEYREEVYRCSRGDLILLGRAFDRSAADDVAALRIGTNQFKVDPDQLLSALRTDWARRNVLVAVAANSKDGTAQLQADASLTALRRKLERGADIIFSSQPKQREFWLGRGGVPPERLAAEWGGCKPCLHGSDAHDLSTVGNPAKDRFCWIKGDLTFESLRQACIEPETRTFVGPQPPVSGMPSQLIRRVEVLHADWLRTPRLPLNPGLVAVIGARGSGKTALVELIAAGSYAVPDRSSDRSFLRRALPYIGDAESALDWGAGERTSCRLASAADDSFDAARIQYLSQQFVDRLCSSEGLADELIAEIERVVFQMHPVEDRLGATDFRGLLYRRSSRARSARARHQAVLAELSELLISERAKQDSLPALMRKRDELRATMDRDKADRSALVGAGQEERAKRFQEVSTAHEQVRVRADHALRRHRALLALRDDVAAVRKDRAPDLLRQQMEAHAEAGLTVQQWQAFELEFRGDVDAVLASEMAKAEALARALKGPAPGEPPGNDAAEPLIADGVDLEQQTLSLLSKETRRLQTLIGIDQVNGRRYAQLSDKIAKTETVLTATELDIAAAQGAETRIADSIERRAAAYQGVFQAIVDEEAELADLYAPLHMGLQRKAGTLAKLSFSVRRRVDIEAWAKAGEELLDLRKSGPFRGSGTLLAEAERLLRSAWETGNAAEVSGAMAAFRKAHERGLREHAKVLGGDREARRAWASRVGAWLYATDHIKLEYGVRYEGVDIELLSPGTRGIVLLLLYLAVDQDDDRPLIVDQPEENLDPKSIYDELVECFRDAKRRRQIIIVTHNANLVVNTDADQVIVASCETHRPGRLPLMRYESGGLENPVIRRHVCDILEGGAAAFQERARRLRVDLRTT